MSDERLRDLERRAATGGPADVIALQRERLRLGLLIPGKRVELHVDRNAKRATFLRRDRLLVQGSREFRGLRIWDVTSQTEIVCFGPDDARLASGSPDGRRVAFAHAIGVHGPDLDRLSRLAVYDVDSGETLWDRPLGPCAKSIAWSPPGDLIACLCTDRTVLVLDAATGEERHRWTAGPDKDVTWIRAGQLLTIGERFVRVWDVATGREVARLEGHSEEVECVAVAPNGSVAVTGGADNTVRVWDLETFDEVACLKGHGKRITGVAVSPYFRRALSSSADGTVRLWDLPTRCQVRKFVDLGAVQRRLERGHVVNGRRVFASSRVIETQDSVAFSPDGNHAASVNAGRVTVWTLPP